MKRPQNFDELLDIAKNRPDIHGALSQLGIGLKRVGYAMGGERWQTETNGGTSGDLSAIAFIEKPSSSRHKIKNIVYSFFFYRKTRIQKRGVAAH